MTVEGLCDINVCIACPREETPGNYVMGSCKIVCHESNILSPKLFVFRGQIPVFRLKRGGNSNGSRYWVVVAHARLKLLCLFPFLIGLNAKICCVHSPHNCQWKRPKHSISSGLKTGSSGEFIQSNCCDIVVVAVRTVGVCYYWIMRHYLLQPTPASGLAGNTNEIPAQARTDQSGCSEGADAADSRLVATQRRSGAQRSVL